jgi:hypothetical protein
MKLTLTVGIVNIRVAIILSHVFVPVLLITF